MWIDPVTAAQDREFRYRLLFPGITHDEYLDEPWDVIEWALRIAEIRGVTPWAPERKGRPDARAPGV